MVSIYSRNGLNQLRVMTTAFPGLQIAALSTKAEKVHDIVRPALLELYGIEASKVKRMHGGRLSNTYLAVTDEGNRFVKVERKSAVPANTAFSTRVTEYGRLKLGMPFPKTYTNVNGELYSTIPSSLCNGNIPEYLQGSTVTVVDFHEKPAPIANTPENTLKQYEALGRYLGEYHKFKDFSLKHKHAAPHGPVEIPSIIGMLNNTFKLGEGIYPHQELNVIGRNAARNLAKFPEDRIAANFATGLEDGFLGKAFGKLSELQEREGRLDTHRLSRGLVNNDIKTSNVFFADEGGKIKVKLAFDLDTVTTEDILVKDLGRAIALNCFDPTTGALQPDKMLALIKGRVSVNPLNKEEAAALGFYIELGIMTSLGIRSTYMAEMCNGESPAYVVDRLNPALHLEEIKSLQEWLKINDLHRTVTDIQKSCSPSRFRG